MVAKIETDGGAISLFRDRGIACSPLGSDLVSRIAERGHRPGAIETQDQTRRDKMRIPIDHRVRLLGTRAFLMTAILLPAFGFANAWAGERGGLGDQVRGDYGYTSYGATEDATVTPCQSCYSGGTNEQNLSPYNSRDLRICESCTDAGRGGRSQ